MHTIRSRVSVAFIFALFLLFYGLATQGSPAQTAVAPDAKAAISLYAGATLQVALIRPVWARTASPGATIYAQTTFPVVAAGRTAIPPGTFVEGRLVKVTRPTRRSNRGELQILFTRVIFANGYVAALPGAVIAGTAPAAPVATGATPNSSTVIAVAVQVSRNSDILLDNGAQIEIALASPLALDPQAVAAAIPLSRAPVPGQFKSASLCRSIPGSPGTPDTVIPGSPGTPDTVIPGGPGMPDTVIPGTPATPNTTIPGTPGSLEIPCPPPPVVISSTPVHTQSG